jgi:hemoglobin
VDATPKSIPTLYEWAGGIAALERLTGHFYDRVRQDELLAPVFEHMGGAHPKLVAQFIGEVLGGPTNYSTEHGGHAGMVTRHLNRHLTEQQRKRWMTLLLESADAIGLPSDPEFRSALVGYIEWGSRLAVINSQGGDGVPQGSPMPRWGWGVVGGPYQP